MAGTPGKECSSLAEGNTGVAENGPAFSPSTTRTGQAGTAGGGAAKGNCGTNPVALVSEAAMARKSTSVSGPGDGVEGHAGAPGIDCMFGTAGKENTSRGKSGIAACDGTAVGSAGELALAGSGVPAASAGTDFPGSAAKNSLASFAISAGSGGDATAADKPSYSGTPACCTPGCGAPACSALASIAGAREVRSAATGSLVVVVLIDIHMFQRADGVIGEDGHGAVE